MNSENKNDDHREDGLLIGGIAFGITLTLAFVFGIHWATQIEFEREGSTFLKDLVLWGLECLIILAAFCVPWLAWKYLVKPHRK
jgi:hypothetical protein